MARRSSGGRSGGGFSRAPKASKSTTPASVPGKSSAPVKSHSVTGRLGAAVVDGLSWGVGTAITLKVVDAVMGSRVFRHHSANDACVGQFKAFKECLKTSLKDIGRCQLYLDMITECRKAARTPTTHPPAATPSATAVNL